MLAVHLRALTCPLLAAPLSERDSGGVKTKGGHSMPRGKKEPERRRL